jgi:hypothetical protein
MKIHWTKLKEQLTETSVLIVILTVILCMFDHTHWEGINPEDDNTIANVLLNRFYFITTTLSSVGYGDIYPVSKSAKLTVSFIHVFVIIHIISILGNF